MINIINKENCVGCNACAQKCPKQCIHMIEDNQGFLYPKVDLNKCINCNLCEKTCPVINSNNPIKFHTAYAANNQSEETAKQSSSGGVFSAIATEIINNGGIVFGACFDKNWNVCHDYTDNLHGLKKFQSSKYVQSNINNCFIKVEQFLKQGRKVLFSGTPCQISGLRLYLRSNYENLLLVEIACHGVPSPLVWRLYLNNLCKTVGIDQITDISFRDKRIGWNEYGFRIIGKDSQNTYKEFFQLKSENAYMLGFVNDLYLRPSCFKCPVKAGKSAADIIIGDFWGIQRSYPKLYQKNMYSLIIPINKKGEKYLKNITCNIAPVDPRIAIAYNTSIIKGAKWSHKVDIFWKQFKAIGTGAIPTLTKKRNFLLNDFIKKIHRIIKLHYYRLLNLNQQKQLP